MTWIHFLLAGLAAMAAGLINALAGGGTLITFPTLIAIGIPAVAANVTNTVALCPGYIGGIHGQRDDLKGQGKRVWFVAPAGIVGGLIGGYLLLHTGEKVFRELVPFLILLASILLAIQGPVRTWLVKRTSEKKSTTKKEWTVALPVGIFAIYGGYFGAGLGVILLSILGLSVDDTLTLLNALKQTISFSTNFAAAIFFIISGKVVWPFALVMAVFALIGRSLGGRLAGRVRPSTLRWIVVTIGVIVAIIYFVRG